MDSREVDKLMKEHQHDLPSEVYWEIIRAYEGFAHIGYSPKYDQYDLDGEDGSKWIFRIHE